MLQQMYNTEDRSLPRPMIKKFWKFCRTVFDRIFYVDVMSAFEFIKQVSTDCHFMSIERPGTKASNSEMRRWLTQKAVEISGQRPGPDDEIVFPLKSLVLFPKGNKRITLW